MNATPELTAKQNEALDTLVDLFRRSRKKAVDREVHLGDADGVAVLLLAIEDDPLRYVGTFLLDEVAGLHEHPARTTGRVEHRAVIRLDDVDDRLHERDWREDLTVVVAFCMMDSARKYS